MKLEFIIATLVCSISPVFCQNESNSWQYYWTQASPEVQQIPNNYNSNQEGASFELIPENEFTVSFAGCAPRADDNYYFWGSPLLPVNEILPDYLAGISISYGRNFAHSDMGFWSAKLMFSYFSGENDMYYTYYEESINSKVDYYQLTGELNYNFSMTDRSFFYIGLSLGQGNGEITLTDSVGRTISGSQDSASYGSNLGFKFYNDNATASFQFGWKYMLLYENVYAGIFNIGVGFTF